MAQKFSMGVRFNHNMGLLETLSFLGEGVGAAVYIIGYLTARTSLESLGIAFVLGAVVVLRAHLGQPTRGWRALTRVHSAWVSRGTLVISAFVGLAVGAMLTGYVGSLRAIQAPLAAAAFVVAIPVILYAGMLLRSMRAIRLWGSFTLPMSFIAHSAASGLVIASVLEPGLRVGAIVALIVAAAMSAVHLKLIKPSAGTQASLQRLLHGDLRARFVVGAGILGVALPLLGLAVSGPLGAAVAAKPATIVLCLAALARIYGDFAYRYAIVVAGAYEPVLPSAPSRPFPRQTPASAVLSAPRG